MTSGPRAMLREDLALLRHLASRSGGMTILAQDPLPWLATIRGASFAPALDVAACRSLPVRTIVSFGDAERLPVVAQDVLHERGFELLVHDGCAWRRVGPAQRRTGLRDVIARALPPLAAAMGVLRLAPPFRHDGGFCWWTSLRGLRLPEAGSDRLAVLFEDGRPLPLRDSPHADIRERGGGRYSVWDRGLYFSASDDSDPHVNGRRYELRVLRTGRDDALPAPTGDEATFAAAFRDLAAHRSDAPPPAERVLLLLSSLGPGGAERQFCNLAKGLVARGIEVGIAALDGFCGAHGHYVPLLAGSGVTLLDATSPAAGFAPAELEARNPGALALLERLPAIFAAEAWRIATHVAAFAPDVLHAALDKPNLLGAIAGVATGVPRIVLSARNVNPTHFPYIDVPWFRRWYAHAAEVPGLVLSANSHAGARDYAAWIGIDECLVRVVHNGLDADAMPAPDDAAVAALRSELGIADGDPVVAGLFRLSAEKRPSLWLEVIARLRQSFPRLVALHGGHGALHDEFIARVTALGLTDTVRLLGRRTDPLRVLRASDLLLLVSTFEGIPNVALEAQWLERPVVCTDAGGSIEAIEDGVTGIIVRETAVEPLAAACERLLRDAPLRARMGQAGKQLVVQRFAVDHMVEASVALHRGSARAESLRAHREERPS